MPGKDKPKKEKQAERRGGRGQGTVFYSGALGCWIWRAIVGYKPDGAVKYKSGRTRTQAEGIRKKTEAERLNTQPHADKETTGEHLDHWLNDIAKLSTRKNTWERYEQVTRLHLKPRIGGIPLRKLTVAQVTKLWATMEREGVSVGNIKKCSEVLASALESAVTENKIPTAPTANAVKPKVQREEIEVFDDAEIRAIMDAAEGDPLYALYLVAIGTGARQGELRALESTDFDIASGDVRITKGLDGDGSEVTEPKSKTGIRTVSLPDFAADAIKAHLANRKPGPAFTTSNGTYISKTNFIRREWKPLLEKAGVRYRKFHVLRHTHASRLLAAGVDPAEVAKRIGDRIETLMKVYAHWIHTTNRDTAAKVSQIYAKPTGDTSGSPPRKTHVERLGG